MAIAYGPRIVTDGLVACLDKYNERSYLGEPFTNLTNTRPGGAMTSWSHGNGTYSSDERVTMNTPVGWEADKLILKQNGSDGWNGSPNLCRIYYGGTWQTTNPQTYYYGCWIYTDNWSQFGTNGYNNVYKYVTGAAGWTAFAATGLEKVVDGLTWKWYANYVSNLPYSGSEYFVFFKNGSFTTDMVFYVAGAMCHSNGNRHIKWADGTRSTTDGWQDLSGNGNHADLTQLSYSATNVPGTNVNDFSFDGVDDRVISDNHTIISDVRGDFSVGIWLKFGGTSGSHHIPFWISDSNGNGFVYIELGSNYGYLGAATETKARNGYVSGANINDNNWHYIVVTRSTGASVVIYKDGASQTVTTHDMYGGWNTGSGGDMSVGVGMDNGSVYGYSYYGGSYSSLAIYSKVLTATEVLQNYNAYKGRFGL